MANQYIKGIRLIDKAGEYTGSYVKLTPIWHGAGTEAVFSHMTFGQHVESGSSAKNRLDYNITSSFSIGTETGSADTFSIEGPIYAFHLTTGTVLASFTDEYIDGIVD